MLDEKMKARLEKKLAKWGIDKKEVVEDFLKDFDTEEEVEEPEKKAEDKEVEKEIDNEIVEEPKEKVENETTEPVVKENAQDNLYKTQIDDLNKKFDDLKALLESQVAKTNKAYEILDAQGKKPSEEEYEYTQKLGTSDIKPNFNKKENDGDEFANALQHKKYR